MNENETKQRIRDFVDHLLSNPGIKSEPLIIGEGLILNFIVQNMDHLKTTFKTPDFFPDLQWNEVLQLILADLYERIIKIEYPVINEFIQKADFHFLSKISGTAPFTNDFHQEKISAFVQSIFRNKDVRYNFNSVVNIFKYEVLEKYITEIFNRRGYLHNELVRVQKIYLEADEYINFLKMLLLIRNSAFMKVSINPEIPDNKICLKEVLDQPRTLNKIIDPFTKVVQKELPNLDSKTIKLAIKSNLGEKHTEKEDASSRFLYIMTSRFKNYRPMKKIDRGAESPDKSWFGIARKTAASQGFDKRMLDDLYLIAGDNNW